MLSRQQQLVETVRVKSKASYGVFFSEELPFPLLECKLSEILTAFAYYYQLFGEEKANGFQDLSIRELVDFFKHCIFETVRKMAWILKMNHSP